MANKEYKEISFDNENIMLNNNYVRGAILPKKASELGRDITVKGDCEVDGAMFGNRIEIVNGEFDVKGAVFAQLELHVNSDAKGNVTFRKSVASAGSVVSYARNCDLSFLSDVNAKSIKLNNAFIAGSIFAEDITLENCVVIGGVFASTSLNMTNCIVGTFNSPTVSATDQINLLLPSAFSIDKIRLTPGTELYSLSLADLGALYRGDSPIENTGRIKININSDEIRTVLSSEESQLALRSYTVVGKVLAADLLDFEKLQNHFLITAASLGSQLLKAYDLGLNSKGDIAELSPDKIREFFFDILNGKIEIQDVEGDFSIESIKSRFT